MGNVVGFVDGTTRWIARPSLEPDEVYDGHHKQYVSTFPCRIFMLLERLSTLPCNISMLLERLSTLPCNISILLERVSTFP